MKTLTGSNGSSNLPPEASAGLRAGFWLCIAVGIAVVARRFSALRRSSGGVDSAPPQLAQLDAWFNTHASLTYAHILIALVFLCVLPFTFWRRTRRMFSIHVALYVLGSLVALTAYAMSAFSVGGWVERSAVLFFNTLFLICLILSLRSWVLDDPAAERRWTLRFTAIVLGIATTRPVMGVFFATSRLSHWTPQQFFGPAFWIGFTTNVLIMELWLYRNTTPTRGRVR